MKTIELSKQIISGTGASQAEPVSPGSLVKVDVVLSGNGAIDANVVLQVTDTPKDEASWQATNINIRLSGQNVVTATDYAYLTKRHYRLVPVVLNAVAVYTVVSRVEESDHPDRVVLLDTAQSAQKSKVFNLPSRKPIALDVSITGTATVRLYASNVETQPGGTRWGAPLREFTVSTKVIIENEPWASWMVEVVSVTGSVSVATGV